MMVQLLLSIGLIQRFLIAVRSVQATLRNLFYIQLDTCMLQRILQLLVDCYSVIGIGLAIMHT
ncbi:hypothetical protein LINPERHAP1_LOCUS9075 [Linum perenne]